MATSQHKKRWMLSATAILLMAALLPVLWYHLEWVLPLDRAQAILNRSFASDLIEPVQLQEWRIENPRWNQKRIFLKTSKFCFRPVGGCLENVEIGLRFEITKSLKIRILELNPVRAVAPQLSYEKSTTPADHSANRWFLWSPKLILLNTDIVVHQWEWPEKSAHVSGFLKGGFDSQGWQGELQGSVAQSKGALSFRLGQAQNAHAPVELSVALQPESTYKKSNPAWSVRSSWKGFWDWNVFRLDLGGDVVIASFSDALQSIEATQLRWQLDAGSSQVSNWKTQLSGQIAATLRPLGVGTQSQVLQKMEWSPSVSGPFELKASALGTPDAQVEVRLELDSPKASIIQVQSKLEGVWKASMANLQQGLKKFWVQAQLPRFEAWVKKVRGTSAEIPAPFASLKGPVELQVGDLNQSVSLESLPIVLKTQLASRTTPDAEQVLHSESSGTLHWNEQTQKFKLVGQTEILQGKLSLPDFDLFSPMVGIREDPRLVTSKMLQKQAKTRRRAEEGVAMEWDWKISTPRSPIQVIHRLAQPAIPVKLSVRFWWDDEQKRSRESGTIELHPFEVEVFQRRARLERYRYELGEVPTRYQGRISVRKSLHTIWIDLVESSGKLDVRFSAEPYLDERDAISMLLYNQTTQELSPDESTSVSDTQSALANQALGLFSVLMLSSTPIEAISYNPASGVYSARVTVGEGLSATVGTDWEATQEFAIRKRIGRSLVLSTVFERDTSTDVRAAKTLLEWTRRF